MTQATPARCFSGMQPTGSIDLGNYLGAVDNWVKLQAQYETFICIVDYHALTIPYEPAEMPGRVFDLAQTFLACGIDPTRTTLFVQSQVTAHTELCWLLNTVTPMGDLGRMTQFKEKSDQHKQHVNVGLFGYPVLQAADIALYHATVVPVGEDQVQHLEFAREIVRKWNARFGDYLVEPKPVLSRTPRVLGLDGKAKMSKSLGNHIGLLDTDEEIAKKLKSAFTDPLKLRRNDPGRPEVCNIFTLHTALTSAEKVPEIERDCKSGALGCGDCKGILAKSMSERLTPIRTRYAELSKRPSDTLDVLEAGGTRCRGIAATTMAEVRDRMGMKIWGAEVVNKGRLRAVVLAVVGAIVATTVYATADCGSKGDSTPEGAFRAFSAALQATREDSEQMRKVYALLSASDRRELERRAKASERLGGEARDGAEMIVAGRVQVAWAPKKIAVAKRGDRRVELAVTGPSKQRARVVMVREGAAWRVSLGLAAE